MKQVPLKIIMPVPEPEPETANELMAVAADRVWVLKKQAAPHVNHEPGETSLFFSRSLHDLMSMPINDYNDYTISYVAATPLHTHWFQLLDMLKELEPQQHWSAWACKRSTLEIISRNIRDWYNTLLLACLPDNIIGSTLAKLLAAQHLTQNILEELT